MTAIRTLLMLLGAFGVLMLGGVAPAMASDAAPPCHEMAREAGHKGSAPSSERTMKSMACCVACVVAPSITPPVRAVVAAPRPILKATTPALPVGRHPSPDTGPPKA